MSTILNSMTGIVIRFLLVGTLPAAEITSADQGAAGPRPATIRDVKPPFAFTIRTTTPAGQPQPGVTIRCLHPRSERGRALVDTTARTDDRGIAQFIVRDANLVTDRYVWFDVVGGDFAGRGPVGISPLDHEFTLTFQTLPLQERTVQFVDPQGKEVAGARVWLRCSSVFPDTSDRRSDANGRMVLRCPPGRLTVAALAPGFASTVHHEAEFAADRPYVIQLDQGHQIQGRILDTEGRPVDGLLVRAGTEEPFHSRDEFMPKTHSGKDGCFTLRNVSPGDWRISAKSEDPNRPLFVVPVTYVVAGSGKAQDVVLEAREGFRIKGRYITKYNTRLMYSGGGYPVALFVAPPLQAFWEEQSREDGTFDIWGLPCHASGDIEFTSVSGFHANVRIAPAQPFFQVKETGVRFDNVPPGMYEGIEVQLLLAGRVEGTVTDAAGAPMRAVEVIIRPPGSIQPCNEQGQFRGEVAPGEAVTLTVRKQRERGPRKPREDPREEALLVSEPFTVQEGQIVEKHLVVASPARRDPPTVQPQPRASLEALNIDVKPETLAGKKVLVCFFDISQRPSRRFVQELAARATLLEQNNLPVLLIHAGGADKDAVQKWLHDSGVPFAAGTGATVPKLLEDWSVQALPWLVLLDESRVIRAAGFDLAQLAESLKDRDLDRLPSRGIPEERGR